MATPFDSRPDEEIDLINQAFHSGAPLNGSAHALTVQLRQLAQRQGRPYQPLSSVEATYYANAQQKAHPGMVQTLEQGAGEGALKVLGAMKTGGEALANMVNPRVVLHPRPTDVTPGSLALKYLVQPALDFAETAAGGTDLGVMAPGGRQALVDPRVAHQAGRQMAAGMAQPFQRTAQGFQKGGLVGGTAGLLAHPEDVLGMGLTGALGFGALHGAKAALGRPTPPKAPPEAPPEPPAGPQATIKFKQPIPVEHTPTGRQGRAVAQQGDTVTVRSNGALYKVPQAELRPLPTSQPGVTTPEAPRTSVPSPTQEAPPVAPGQALSGAPQGAPTPKATPPDVQAKADAFDAETKQQRARLQADPNLIGVDKQRALKSLGMSRAAERRQLTGELTAKEQAQANRPFQKGVTQVQLPDGTTGTYQGHVYGKINVKTEAGQVSFPANQVERLGNTPDEVQAATSRVAVLRQSIQQKAAELRPVLEGQDDSTTLGSGLGGFDPHKIRAAAYDLADRVLSGKAGDALEAWEGYLRDFGTGLSEWKDHVIDHAKQLLDVGRIGKMTEGALPPGTPETGGIAPKPVWPEGSLEQIHHEALAANPGPDELAQIPGAPKNPTDLGTLRGLLDAGMGYRNWYKEYGTRLFTQLGLTGENHQLDPQTVTQLSPEIRAVWATTAASASPFQNLRSTLATMTHVREMMKDGTWDATDPTGTAKALWRRLNADRVFLSGKAGRPGDQTGQLFRLYNEGRIGTGGAKIVSFGIGTHEASQGAYSPFPVVDRHIIRASGLGAGTEGSVPDSGYRFVASIVHHLAAEKGISPLQAQAAMWEPARIIGDDYYTLKHEAHLKDGTVIPAGSEVAVVDRGQSGTLMIRHPVTLENKRLTKAVSEGATRHFEGVKTRVKRGVPEGQAVAEAFQEAQRQQRFQGAGDMGGRVRQQVEGEFRQVQPLARRLHDALAHTPLAAQGETPPERIYAGSSTIRPAGKTHGKGVVSPYDVTPETSQTAAADVAARSPVVFMSAVPGAGPVPEASAAIHEAVWPALINPETGKLKALADAGIAHEVLNPSGHGGWEGQYDPSIRVRLIGATTDVANQVASLYGPLLGQDAVAVYVPDAKVPSISVAALHLDHPITLDEFRAYQQSFAEDGFDAQTGNDGRSLEVLHFPDPSRPQGSMAWYNSLYDAAEKAGLPGVHVEFKPSYSYLVGNGKNDVPYPSAEPPALPGGSDGAGAPAGVQGQPGPTGRSLLSGAARGVASDIRAGAASAQLPAGADPALVAALGQMKARLDHLAGEAAGLHSFPGKIPQLFIEGDNLKAFLADARVIGSYYLDQGLTDFSQWSHAVYTHITGIGADLADALRPHLADLYRASLRQAIATPGTPDKAGLKRLYNTPVTVPVWLGLSDQPQVVQTALAKITQDPSGQLALSQALQAAPPALGVQTFAQQASRARVLADQLRIDPGDPDIAINRQAVDKMSGVEINALMNLTKANTELIVRESRRLALPDARLSDATRQMSQDLIQAAQEQNNALFGKIVEARSQKGRDLGALRQIAQASSDPEVWMVQAKQALGDRPLTPAIQNDLYRLANKIREVC